MCMYKVCVSGGVFKNLVYLKKNFINFFQQKYINFFLFPRVLLFLYPLGRNGLVSRLTICMLVEGVWCSVLYELCSLCLVVVCLK